MSDTPTKSMEEVIVTDGRYPPEAYAFLHEALSAAVKEAHGEPMPAQRHVTGQQICQAIRKLALERWGMLASAVLEKWNIRSTIDFGEMVYLLIEHNFMKKTEEDGIEDFRDVFSFDEALRPDDEFELKE